jgi:hypothetical protein
MLGDEILGYIPLRRRSRYSNGESLLIGFRVFIEVKDTGDFYVASGSEIGGMAAIAYDKLPAEKKNDISKNTEKYQDPTEFVDILGVACIAGTSRSNKYPITYVWVKTTKPTKHADILTRSSFRQWLGASIADKLIDNWFVKKKITPEWAIMGFDTDPANDSRYLALTFPPPRQRRQGWDNRWDNPQPRIEAGASAHSLRSRNTATNMQASGLGHSRMQDGDVTVLLNQLIITMVEDRKERREDRKVQQAFMGKFLTTSNSS